MLGYLVFGRGREIQGANHVVAGVRDVVEPQVALQCLDEAARGNVSAEHFSDPGLQLDRVVGGHPIA